MFFTSHLKRYINRYEKATFFALKTSHTNNLRVTSLAGNSYPYYQDKKEKDFSLRSNPLKKHKRPHFLMWSFVADEIYRPRELKQNALVENAEREGKRQRIAEMTDFLNKQSAELEEYDEQLVRRLIEKVTIYEDKLTVEFKSGIEIDEEI